MSAPPTPRQESSPERDDNLTDAVHQAAADAESLRARLTAAVARLETVESQLAETRAAQTRAAAELERLRGALRGRAALEKQLTEVREEVHERLAGVDSEVRRALDEMRQRQAADAERSARELAALSDRMRETERLNDRLAGLARGHADLAGAVSTLGARVDGLAEQRNQIEEQARQRESRLESRARELTTELQALAKEVSLWRARIESQDDIVRRAERVAQAMQEQMEHLQRDQHELGEANRLFAERVEALLAEQASEAQAVWEAFHRQRAHEWARLQDEGRQRDTALDKMEHRVADALDALSDLGASVDDRLAGQGKALDELRRAVLDALGEWRRGADELAAVVERGLPREQRPSGVEERRMEQRRSMRAGGDRR